MEFISWSLNAGQIIEIAAIILSFSYVGAMMGKRVTELEKEIKQLSEVVTQLAVQHERLDRVEADLRDLRHGHGFVMPFNSTRT